MITDSTPLSRHEIATLLASVIYRQLRTFQRPQNLAPSLQDSLDVLPKEVLTVTTTVNSTTAGENHE